MGIHRQRGWATVIVLVALAVVGYLARDSIVRLLMPARTTDFATRAAAAQATDPSQSTVLPSAPIERARAIEDVVHQRAERSAGHVDASR